MLNFNAADMGSPMVSFSSDPSLLGGNGVNHLKLDGSGSPGGYNLPLSSLHTPTSSNDTDAGLHMFTHTDRSGMHTPHPHHPQPQPVGLPPKMDYSTASYAPQSLSGYTTLQPSNPSIPLSPSFITPDLVTKQEAFIDTSQQQPGRKRLL